MTHDTFPHFDQPAASECAPCLVEECVADDRNACTPSELVQRKLEQLSSTVPLPASNIHTGRVVRRYTL